MSCQEVVFAGGTCRLDVIDSTVDPTMPLFRVRMQLIDPDHAAAHDLVLENGGHAEIHAPTEALAISTATTFLERHFGALSEYTHGCTDFGAPPVPASAIVVSAP